MIKEPYKITDLLWKVDSGVSTEDLIELQRAIVIYNSDQIQTPYLNKDCFNNLEDSQKDFESLVNVLTEEGKINIPTLCTSLSNKHIAYLIDYYLKNNKMEKSNSYAFDFIEKRRDDEPDSDSLSSILF